MEHYKISKLLNDSSSSTFGTTKKWIEVNDLSGGQNSVNKNITFKIKMLTSDLCNYSNAHIFVKGRISIRGNNDAKKRNKKLTFKNKDRFISSINTLIDNTEEDIDVVMSMYNLLEYSDNYSMASGSLWNYYREEVNDSADETDDDDDNTINNYKTTTSKSFKYRKKMLGCTPNNNNIFDAEVIVPTK